MVRWCVVGCPADGTILVGAVFRGERDGIGVLCDLCEGEGGGVIVQIRLRGWGIALEIVLWTLFYV